MRLKKIVRILLAFFVVAQSTAALASSTSAKAQSCAVSLELSPPEFSDLLMFNAHLSHLLYTYGKPNFESKLQSIIEGYWPKTRVIQVSPFYFEKVSNLVDQARLKNSIALTIGLDSDSWTRFERIMKDITLMQSQGFDLVNPMEATTQKLIKEIGTQAKPANVTADIWGARSAEALMRVSQMYSYMVRWRSFNGDAIDEKAAASAKSMAVLAIGLVGAGVLCSTLVVSAPIVSGAGLIAARLATTPAISSLLVRVAETAAGSMIGFFGAPAAVVVQDSYHVLSEAGKQSANSQTDFSCELAKQNTLWRQQAGGKLVSAALIGAGMGVGGGALTFTTKSAQAVLYATGFGVGVAQLYSVGKMSATAIESLAFYKMAEEAETAKNHELALGYLYHARDLAQESGEHGLEAIIIATLSYHVSIHFMHALHEGSSAIRQLYAASADTLPTAAKAAVNLGNSAIEVVSGKKAPTP